MPTAYEDQFFTVDPGAPPPSGTILTFQRIEFIDEDDDGNIETNTGDTWNGNTVAQVWQGDTLTVNVPGVGNITYTGVTFYFTNGDPPVFTPTDGQVLQNGTFVSSTFVTTPTQTPVTNFGPTCFTPGTLIDTRKGPIPVEQLKVGDEVLTLDGGFQQIRFIVDDIVRATERHTPVLFEPGSFENKVPLMVSQQHRLLVTDWRAEHYWGQDEILVAAKHLVNGTSIRLVPGGSVRYIHLLFDKHQIIIGNGVPSESMYPEFALEWVTGKRRKELLLLFPELRRGDGFQPLARQVIRGREAPLLAI